jgi:acyl-CoA dehydrogenase
MIARGYVSAPIAITVEGANILTRSLIIYGQGAIRCHPFVLEEMRAVEKHDVERFDRAFFGHLGFIAKNAARVFFPGAGRGHLGTGIAALGRAETPVPALRRTLRQLGRMSAAFALASDAAMATLGGQLKRREKLSGRLADALAWLYLGSAAAKRFWDDGQRTEDLPFLRWSAEQALWKSEEALVGLLDNFPNRPAAWLLRRLLFPFGPRRRPPSDRLGGEIARALLDDEALRRRLTADIFVPGGHDPGLGQLETAFAACKKGLAVRTKIREAVRARRIARSPETDLPDRALGAGIISPDEHRALAEAERARDAAIEVDAFDDLKVFDRVSAGQPSVLH